MTEYEIISSHNQRFLRIYDEDEEFHFMIALDDADIEAIADQAEKWTDD